MTATRLLIDALDRYLRQDETAADTDNGVYRQGQEAMAAALSTPPAVMPAAPSDAVTVPRELLERIVERLRKAQIFHLSGELNAALTQPTTVQQALTEDQIRDGFRDYDKELVARHRTPWQIWRDSSVWALKTAQTTALPGDKEAA